MQSRNWIGGEWHVPTEGESAVYNPSNLTEQVGKIYYSGASDVKQAEQAAREAVASWAGLPASKRGEYLARMASVIQEQLDQLAYIASSEMGKPIQEMKGEVMRGIDILRYYAAEGVRAVGNVIPSTQATVLQYTKRVPLGVVAIITPWNFPVAIPIWKMAPALICGNTVIWKPAEIASLTAALLAKLFEQSGLPKGVVNLVIGKGSKIGKVLIENCDINAMSFTGSTSTGQKLAAQCAGRNIKFQTEMGGKNAAVVLKDANVEKAVSAIVSGAFRSAGQKCTATSRIIVEREILSIFYDELKRAMANIKLGPAWEPSVFLGPVASKDQYETVMKYREMARSEAEIVTESTVRVSNLEGYYIHPLVVTGVESKHALVQEEVFGPLAVVLEANDFDHAVELCNQTIFGLSASIFTQDLSKGMHFLDLADAGMVRVNQETAGVEYQSPFGGMKLSSSHSREQGQAALDFYSMTKTCAIDYT